MSITMLRDYQKIIDDRILEEWSFGHRNIIGVLPCGGGKTVNMACMAKREQGESRTIAHRQELVGQISMTYARNDVYHRIIAPDNVVKFIVDKQIKELGRSYHHSAAPAHVAGVDTLLRREDDRAKHVALWQLDETHHLVVGNKWHRALSPYVNARGAGWTATPTRTDRKLLSRGSGTGVFDSIVVGPSPRDLIERGYLTDFIIYGPPPSIDRKSITVGQSGEFTGKGMRHVAEKSRIVGDVAQHYMRIAPGELGVTFAIDVGMAERHAEAFRHYGVPTEIITDKTKNRDKILEAFARREIRQIVNVDILGEGFDLPAMVVVSMARPTESYGLYTQQFFRALRLKEGKRFGIIIDHVGNVQRHGLPDGVEDWSLSGKIVQKRGDRSTPVRMCENPACFRAYEGYSLTCPYCGWRPEPIEASEPDMVEGDLTQYGPELLKKLREQATQAICIPTGKVKDGRGAVIRDNMVTRANVQHQLRDQIAWWAGIRRDVFGETDEVIYRRFYKTFNIDVLSAQGLGAPKAMELTEAIQKDLYR